MYAEPRRKVGTGGASAVGHKAERIQPAAPLFVEFRPFARRRPVAETLERYTTHILYGGINPPETQSLLNSIEIPQGSGRRGFATFNRQPALLGRQVIPIQLVAEITPARNLKNILRFHDTLQVQRLPPSIDARR